MPVELHYRDIGHGITEIDCMVSRRGLAAAGVLKGRTSTAYPAVRPDIDLQGGTWCEVNATASNACTDGNLVTAPAWPAHPEWMRAFLKVLGSTIEP